MPKTLINQGNDAYIASYVSKATRDKVIRLQSLIQLRERRFVRTSEIIRHALDEYCDRELAKEI